MIVGLAFGSQSQAKPQNTDTPGGVAVLSRIVVPGLSVGEAEPEPTATPEAEPQRAPWPSQLTRDELMEAYELANVPTEWRDSLASIAWCESRWSPGARGDSGNSLGMHQLWRGWFTYGGLDPEQWADPVVNAQTAVVAIRYDLDHGYPAFAQWSCQP